jgi:hypothetical protein
LLLLKNEVIAFAGEICASKSANGTNPKIRSGSVLMATLLFLMERILFEVASGRMAGWPDSKMLTAERLSEALGRANENDVRQGIARARRHVAPARLLC